MGRLNDIKGPPLFLWGFLPRTRFALPLTGERRLSMPEIDEKERDYYIFEVIQTKVL